MFTSVYVSGGGSLSPFSISNRLNAITSAVAADKLIDAMTKVDTFLKGDPSGQRAFIFKMMMMQTMTAKSGEKGGHNTFFMTDVGVPAVTPVPTR